VGFVSLELAADIGACDLVQLIKQAPMSAAYSRLTKTTHSW